jgi:ferritin-like metal-binding protein YciE
MASKQQVLVEWLRDAYAMEREAITLYENQLERLSHYTDFKAKLQEHLERTREQAELLKACLARYGSDASTLKDMVTRLVGNVRAMTIQAADDEAVKYALADYTYAHFEIGSYRCNIAAADEAGDAQTKADLERILAEEEAMAEWLAAYIPQISRTYMTTQEKEPELAKR